MQSVQKGFAQVFLWSDAPFLNLYALNLTVLTTGLLAYIFANKLLNIKTHNTLSYKLFLVSSGLAIVSFTLYCITPHPTLSLLVIVFSVATIFNLIITSYILAFQKTPLASYFSLAWTVLFLSVVMYAFDRIGVIEHHPFYDYFLQIGFLLEAVLFSYLLANHITRIQHEKLELQQELMKKQKLLMQQSKLAAIGEMIGAIAHQWRQPLNTIAIMNQDVVDAYNYNELNKEYLDEFEKNSMKTILEMSDMIDNFRNFFAKKEEKTHFVINNSIYRVIDILKAQLKANNISYSLNENGCELTAYENSFRQIILTLLNNSIDAIKKNKVVSGIIRIDVQCTQQQLTIIVNDNGGGIDETILDRIFEPYYTTKFASSGRGISLYMVNTIVNEQFHGSVNVMNSNSGAQFTLTIPLGIE
jgi:signal transduction histidine kinase